MKIESIWIGCVTEIASKESGDWWDKAWTSGIYKRPVEGRVWLDAEGLIGDEQADRRFHGGIDKAVFVYPLERYGDWTDLLGEPTLDAGAFGENFVVSGMLEDRVCVGDRFEVGEALVEISQPRQPCWKASRRCRRKDLVEKIERTGWTGFYLRVAQTGWVEAGECFRLLSRPNPDWSIARCNEVMRNRLQNAAEAGELSRLPSLSASWSRTLSAAAQRGDGLVGRDAKRRIG